MTREMNKPDWHNKWTHKEEETEQPKERKLNEDIAEFFYATNERLK